MSMFLTVYLIKFSRNRNPNYLKLKLNDGLPFINSTSLFSHISQAVNASVDEEFFRHADEGREEPAACHTVIDTVQEFFFYRKVRLSSTNRLEFQYPVG